MKLKDICLKKLYLILIVLTSWIGFLLGRFKLATMLGGDLGLINVSKSTKKILEMSGALKVIPIYDNFKFAI